MPIPVSEKRARFRRLHESGCFVIPNPWDLGSARYLQHLGFPALASTSSGLAWSMAQPDNAVQRDRVLAHLAMIADGVDVPVNADFEDGYAENLDGLAANVALAVGTGIAGLSIEDASGNSAAPLYEMPRAVDRIKTARAAIDRADPMVMLVARAECFLVGRPDLKETIARLAAYAEAGADCLYAPGLRTKAEIASVVKAVAPKPVNVLARLARFHRRRSCRTRRAANQRWRCPLAHGLGRLHARRSRNRHERILRAIRAGRSLRRNQRVLRRRPATPVRPSQFHYSMFLTTESMASTFWRRIFISFSSASES